MTPEDKLKAHMEDCPYKLSYDHISKMHFMDKEDFWFTVCIGAVPAFIFGILSVLLIQSW